MIAGPPVVFYSLPFLVKFKDEKDTDTYNILLERYNISKRKMEQKKDTSDKSRLRG